MEIQIQGFSVSSPETTASLDIDAKEIMARAGEPNDLASDFSTSKSVLSMPSLIQSIINKINVSNFQDHINTLANQIETRLYGSDGNLEAVEFIANFFEEEAGLETTFHYFGSGEPNVIATIPGGSLQNNACIVVGAHLDTYPKSSPGADDNASGVAAVMEIARAMSQYTYNYTIIFVAFNAEESGLIGSSAYASSLKVQNVDVVVVYNFDMIMWDNPSAPADKKIDIIHNGGASGNFASHAVNCGRNWINAPLQSRYAPGWTMSDHSPFWAQGYPAVWYFENGAAENGHGIHSSADSTSHPEYSFSLGTQVTKAAGAAIADTATIVSTKSGFPHPVFLTPSHEDYVYPHEEVPLVLHIDDDFNDITRIEFSTDGTTWVDITSYLNATNYCNFNWNASEYYGPLSLRARVYDAAGWIGRTRITIILDNGVHCALHTPEYNEDIALGETYTIWVNASDADGYPLTAVKVKINDSKWLSTTPSTTIGSYFYNWSVESWGPLIIQARAQDVNGHTNTTQVPVTVKRYLPLITGVTWNPNLPTDSDTIQVSAQVTQDSRGSGIQMVLVTYSVDYGNWVNRLMTLTDSATNTYTTSLDPFPVGSNVRFYIRVWDNLENIAVNDNNGLYYTYTVTSNPTFMLIIVGGSTCIAATLIGIGLLLRRRRT